MDRIDLAQVVESCKIGNVRTVRFGGYVGNFLTS